MSHLYVVLDDYFVESSREPLELRREKIDIEFWLKHTIATEMFIWIVTRKVRVVTELHLAKIVWDQI